MTHIRLTNAADGSKVYVTQRDDWRIARLKHDDKSTTFALVDQRTFDIIHLLETPSEIDAACQLAGWRLNAL